MHSVYFCCNFPPHGNPILPDLSRRSYIGYSNNIPRRYRQHALKLKKGARATKRFQRCWLWVVVSGFPSRSLALSYEWYAKRRRCFNHHLLPLKFSSSRWPHYRLPYFCQPLRQPRFAQLSLTLHWHPALRPLVSSLSPLCNLALLSPPYQPDHLAVKTRKRQ